MPWKWKPMKGSYQKVPYPESESVSAQIKAPELWKKNNQKVEDDGFITLYPEPEIWTARPKNSPPLKPMEVEEGSITFPKK